MSHKNRREIQKKRSTHSRLDELTKRRNDLIQDRKKLSLENKKKLRLRKLKLYLAVMKLSLPFVISSGVCIGGGALFLDSLPFVVDEQKLIKKHTLEIDDDTVVYEEKYYKPSVFEETDENKIEVKYDFEMDKLGTYSRKVEEYTYSDACDLAVIDAVLDYDYDTLREFAEKRASVTEIKNADDTKRDESIKGQITIRDESDFLMTRESDFKNKAVTIGELAVVFLVSLIGFKLSDRNIEGRKLELENEYQLADLTELDKEIAQVDEELQKVRRLIR